MSEPVIKQHQPDLKWGPHIFPCKVKVEASGLPEQLSLANFVCWYFCSKEGLSSCFDNILQHKCQLSVETSTVPQEVNKCEDTTSNVVEKRRKSLHWNTNFSCLCQQFFQTLKKSFAIYCYFIIPTYLLSMVDLWQVDLQFFLHSTKHCYLKPTLI